MLDVERIRVYREPKRTRYVYENGTIERRKRECVDCPYSYLVTGGYDK